MLGDRALQREASYTLGLAYYAIGDFGQATELLRRNVEAADRESGTSGADVRIRSQAWLGLTLSILGIALQRRAKRVRWKRRLDRVSSLTRISGAIVFLKPFSHADDLVNSIAQTLIKHDCPFVFFPDLQVHLRTSRFP